MNEPAELVKHLHEMVKARELNLQDSRDYPPGIARGYVEDNYNTLKGIIDAVMLLDKELYIEVLRALKTNTLKWLYRFVMEPMASDENGTCIINWNMYRALKVALSDRGQVMDFVDVGEALVLYI